jgi:putative hemolysin
MRSNSTLILWTVPYCSAPCAVQEQYCQYKTSITPEPARNSPCACKGSTVQILHHGGLANAACDSAPPLCRRARSARRSRRVASSGATYCMPRGPSRPAGRRDKCRTVSYHGTGDSPNLSPRVSSRVKRYHGKDVTQPCLGVLTATSQGEQIARYATDNALPAATKTHGFQRLPSCGEDYTATAVVRPYAPRGSRRGAHVPTTLVCGGMKHTRAGQDKIEAPGLLFFYLAKSEDAVERC